MRLKLFRASSVAEAMTKVRGELGPNALILGTRRVGDGVELTAAIEPEADHVNPVNPPALSEPADVPGRAEAFRWHGIPPSLAARLANGPLDVAVAAALPFQSLNLQAGSAPLLLAGPPGSGKTLTAARLATRLVMAGTAPLVITADGRRAGAAEQLAAFTRILGLTLIVASQPAPLAKALARRQQNTPVLIDGPGLNPFDPAQRQELADLAFAAGATIVLVIPAGLDPAEAEDVASAFAVMGAAALIVTRLDLARRMGGVLTAAMTGLALSEAGVGPGAMDGLVACTPAFIANRLTKPSKVRHGSDDAAS